MKRIAILQSNYLPWKGYFDIINSVDEFVLYDTVQYTKNDWRNRNVIKTKQGEEWLTVPVRQGSLQQLINETRVASQIYRKKHLNSLKTNYAKAPCFKHYRDEFEYLYMEKLEGVEFLSDVNLIMIEFICRKLGITTRITRSERLKLEGDKQARLIDACKKLDASVYLSGPSAKGYIKPELFEGQGISVEWQDYSRYKEYAQFHPPFSHYVSVLDLLFHTGADAMSFIQK